MNTLKTLSLTGAMLLLFGCSSPSTDSPEIPETPELPESTTEEVPAEETATPNPVDEIELITMEDGTYTIFSMNVHDWVYAEDSIATLHKVIDIHEEHEVPVDIYVTWPTMKNYLEMDPELVDRFIHSEVVTMAYHYRPPYPYYNGFDEIDLIKMDDDELYETLLEYETHDIDLSTGLTTEEPGGLQAVIEALGSTPVLTGVAVQGKIGETLASIYADMGALFTVEHGRDLYLGETKYGLYIRPETQEVKLYEKIRETIHGSEVFEETLGMLTGEGVEVIGMKYHENNFYLTGTPFWPIYWKDSDKAVPLSPPYDLDASFGVLDYRPQSAQARHWALYESTVAYAAEHRDSLNPLSVSDLYVLP